MGSIISHINDRIKEFGSTDKYLEFLFRGDAFRDTAPTEQKVSLKDIQLPGQVVLKPINNPIGTHDYDFNRDFKDAYSFETFYNEVMKKDRSESASIGWEMIKIERSSQIFKHGYSLKWDAEKNANGELEMAAKFWLSGRRSFWPKGWEPKFMDRYSKKDPVEKLVYAGSFLLAEFTRTKNIQFFRDSLSCGRIIDLIR